MTRCFFIIVIPAGSKRESNFLVQGPYKTTPNRENIPLDDEVEYIEVKTKLGSSEELIEITGTQWEFARMLYNRGDGKNYSIYIVANAQSNPKIIRLNDPIALWKAGKLYAHPVNFRL